MFARRLLWRRRIESHAVYVDAGGRIRGQRVGMRVAVAEGQVVGGSHHGGAHVMPMSVVVVEAQRAGATLRNLYVSGEIRGSR